MPKYRVVLTIFDVEADDEHDAVRMAINNPHAGEHLMYIVGLEEKQSPFLSSGEEPEE